MNNIPNMRGYWRKGGVRMDSIQATCSTITVPLLEILKKKKKKKWWTISIYHLQSQLHTIMFGKVCTLKGQYMKEYFTIITISLIRSLVKDWLWKLITNEFDNLNLTKRCFWNMNIAGTIDMNPIAHCPFVADYTAFQKVYLAW